MTATTLFTQQMQIGKQTVFATAVTPTAKLNRVEDGAGIQPEIKVQEYTTIGNLAPTTDNEILATRGSASVPAIGTYEDLPYALDALFGVATPSGAGPYVYTYTAPLTAQPTRRISTLVFGDSTQAYGLVGAMLNSFGLSIESEGDWRIAQDFVGAYVGTDAIAALSDRAATIIKAAHTTIYIDAFAGTIGTTAIDCEAYSVNLNISPNILLIPALGSLSPCDETGLRYTADLQLTMEFPGTSKAMVEGMLGLTPTVTKKLIRIGGTDGTNIANLDFAGALMEAPFLLTDRDGVTTVELSFRAEVDTGTFANWFKASVTNAVATLP